MYDLSVISDLLEPQFAKILHDHLSPASPVQSEELLFGRDKQLRAITQALYAVGRTVFIFGDRGVGKTSLAQTVAYSHQSAVHDPVLLACEPQTTFADIMNDAVDQLAPAKITGSTSTSVNLKVGFKGLSLDTGATREWSALESKGPVVNLNDLINALFSIAKQRVNESTFIIIDEFDRIIDDIERAHFADFIKQIGDQKIPLKFLFCGVADSLQKLLGTHESCYRYVEEIHLDNLKYEARYEIVDTVAKALGCQITDPYRYRIAAISDGFPHYIHRMCEKLFWQMYSDERQCTSPTTAHYREAVAESVLSMEQHLKGAYEKAVLRDADGYEEILWAMADHSDMIRSADDIYTSYLSIMNLSEDGDEPMDRKTVSARITALKSKACGSILIPHRRGWYQFKENIIRGYVRLRAEEQGVELATEYAAASASGSQSVWKQSSRRRRFGTRREDMRRTQYHDIKETPRRD
jgi:uncharacterized protein